MYEVEQVIIIVVMVLTLVTLVLAGVSIRIVIDGLQGPSRSGNVLVKLFARTAGFILVSGMLGALAYCGVALVRFLGWLA